MADAPKQSGNGQLDLSGVETEDHDKLASSIETYYQQDSSQKVQLAYNWERNHLFLDGHQWLVFDGDKDTGGIWRRLTVSKSNEFIPRPVTNYIFDSYQTLKSYLIKSKPRSTVRPNTQTNRDKTAAKVADLCLECNWERLNEQANYEYAAACLITYGTVFKKSYWDNSAVNTSFVKVPRMTQQPQMDPMTGAMVGMQEVQETDPLTGELMFDEMPLGDVNTDIVEPYRIAVDPLASDLHKARWIMEYSIQHLDWIKEVYGKNGDGYTGKVEEVKEEGNLSGSLRRFHSLKGSSGIRGTQQFEGASASRGDSPLINSAVVKEYYERPSQKFPRGRLVVVANSVVLYSGDSPCSGPEHGDWHPYSECRWEIVPGRFWGKSPLDAAVEIQKQVNSIDAVIVLTRKTMAIPQKRIPTSAGIAAGSWTGRPGQEIFYRDSGGNPPETIPASGVDPTVFQERQQRVEDIKNVTGGIDILKGDRPPGVTAASALNLLYEVGTGKLFPVLDRWKKFVETDQKKQLKLIANNYKEPREDYIKLLQSKNSELSYEAINRFIGTDLYDNCNVFVEAGSNVPKLQAAKQAMLMEAAQVGTLGLDQPANRIEFNRQMGIQGFDNDVGPDTKRAEWENDIMDSIEQNPDKAPVVLPFENHDIHIEVLTKRMKEPSFMDAPPAVQQAYFSHLQEHKEIKNQLDMQKQIQAMESGMPPQPDQGPAPAQPAGKGISTDMQESLRSDMNQPGGPM